MTSKLKAKFSAHRDEVQILKVLPNNELASGSLDNTIKIWNTQLSQLNWTLAGHTDSILCIEKLKHYEIVSGSADHTIRVWDTRTG